MFFMYFCKKFDNYFTIPIYFRTIQKKSMDRKNTFLTLCAPLQGFTEAPFRHFHAEIYGDGIQPVTYIMPFVRIEKGNLRPKDLRELTSPLNQNQTVIPQIIFRDEKEFCLLTNAIRDAGYKNVDLNLGCPFTPQVKKGRGAGLIANPAALDNVRRMMEDANDMTYSIKMRLGIKYPKEWREIADIINAMPLSHLTLHPRTAVQQYSGAVYFDEFAEFKQRIIHPVIYNGDITAPSQIDDIVSQFPDIAGVMIGRGLLMRPSLIIEWKTGQEWSAEQRRSYLLRLHDAIFNHFVNTLTGGDAQILTKIKPFWEYFGIEFDRKAIKKISKAMNMSGYRTAVGLLTP